MLTLACDRGRGAAPRCSATLAPSASKILHPEGHFRARNIRTGCGLHDAILNVGNFYRKKRPIETTIDRWAHK